MINIKFKEKSFNINLTKPMTIFQIAEMINNPAGTAELERAGKTAGIVAAKVDNEVRELGYQVEKDCRIELLDLSSEDGMKIYRRSLVFVLVMAASRVIGEKRIVVHHSVGNGIYCEFAIKGEVREFVTATEEQLRFLEAEMRRIIDQRLPFIKHVMTVDKVNELLEKTGRKDRLNSVGYRLKPHSTIYECDGYLDYFYGYMVPDTGYLDIFRLIPHAPGFILAFPEKANPGIIPGFKEQSNLFSIFREYKRWNRILDVENVGALNEIISKGDIRQLIFVSEALHEKKIANIADNICNSRRKIVLVSGPSSSGKTTFTHRLGIQLRVNGLKPVMISLDDYFFNREDTPVDEFGQYDFEALEAIDIELFNKQLEKLINMEEVEVPSFNFSGGYREKRGKPLKLDREGIVLVEGIHGLNERLTHSISKNNKYKVYVSALTTLNLDDHNRIHATDIRLLRRIVRDNRNRGSDARNTIKMWPSVRRGEEKNIFPFQEDADSTFNSAMVYETSILKGFAEKLLDGIDSGMEEYSEAKRLLEFLGYFLPLDARYIPYNSIIREFIGGNCFYE